MTKIKYELMKEAGSILRDAFGLVFYYLIPGVNLEKIDREIGSFLSSKWAVSAQKLIGFPFNVCISVNHEVIQGYPNKILSEEDIVSVDMTLLYKGVYVDKARTVTMPSADKEKQKLSSVVSQALFDTIPFITPTTPIGDIGRRISNSVEGNAPFNTCHYFHGHGIGDRMHENPMIPNYDNGSMEVLGSGKFVTVEPIIYARPFRRLFFDHQWTITSDELSAHAEETVYITNDGVEVIT
jgi:methionyl aminopeptidase